MLSQLRQDLHFAVRSFLRAPRFTVPATLALALGIGATSAMFSIVRGVLLEPLPYREPERVVSLWESNASRNRPRNVVGPANFIAWRERNRSFAALGMVGPARLNVLLGDQPDEISGLSASADVFSALGVQAALGRVYTPDEDISDNDAVIVLSHEFWQTRLGGRPEILDTTLTTSGRLRRVIGVMPPGFSIEGQRAAFYVPYGWTVEALRNAPGRGSSHGIARLRDGVTIEQAQDEMRTIARQLEQEAPRRNTGWSVAVVPIHEGTVEAVKPALSVLSIASLLVLLIACVNVANLLLARSTARQREIGLRTALGAGRGRLLRQMLTESVLLSLVGGAAGLLLAAAFHRGLAALVAGRIPVPRLEEVTLDGTAVAVTLLLSAVTGVLFGLLPALFASSSATGALADGVRSGTHPRARRALGILVVAEVALAVVLLAGAGLLLRSVIRLQQVDPGFQPEQVLTARVTLPAARYGTSAQQVTLLHGALDRVREQPGVSDAAGITFLPLAGPGIGTSFYRVDQPKPADGQLPSTEVRPVTEGFFTTMRIPRVAGRDFTRGDTAESPDVAIVSAGLVQRHFPGEDPLGRRLLVSIGPGGGMNVEIVGVVGDIKFTGLDVDTSAAVYIPLPQLSIGLMSFVVRSPLEPTALAAGVRSAVRALDPELPVADVAPMETVLASTLARPRAVSVLVTAFAAIALLLAAIGVYGVMSYSVSQRTQEIGVRVALGASGAAVLRLVLGQSLRLVMLGALIGLISAAAFSSLLQSLLFGIGRLDPLALGVATLLILLVGGIASYVPARRGMRIAPTEALRIS